VNAEDADAAAADGFVVLARPADATGPRDAGAPPARRPEPAQVVACPDGPLLVRGDVEIVGPDGEVLPRDRRTVALCRCGTSSIKPWCDGTHKAIGFRTGPEPAPR